MTIIKHRNRCGHRDEECQREAYERFSLGIYAGHWCDKHWATSGYRKEGREGFDPADAGETYEPDEGDW
jgi:ribosomal protein L37AE/L43A